MVTPQRLLDPFIRVRIADQVFTSGDGLLQECSVTLAEGAGASRCSFSIYDKNRVIADRFFTYVEEIEGLVPPILDQGKTGEDGRTKLPTSSKGAWTSNGNLPASLSGFDQARLQKAIDFYLSNGFPPVATAALVGTILQESSLKTNEVSYDGNGSLGLFQWTDDRLQGMPSDFEGQLEFSLSEMDRDSPGVKEILQNPNVTEEEARQAVQDWIRWGELGSRWEYADEIQEAIGDSKPSQQAEGKLDEAKKPTKRAKTNAVTKAGSQITIEMGYGGAPIAAYSFLHTGLTLDVFAPDKLTFAGQAASWVLAQYKNNTAYTNLSFKQIAQQVASKYGLNLEMTEDGPTYEYFAQRGITDYDMLLIEARRLGFRIQTVGNTLKIGAREVKDQGFRLIMGENMGTTLTVTHEAAGQSSGGARSSDPSAKTTTGEKKFAVDPDTGEVVQQQEEVAGAGNQETNALETTGNHAAILKPIESEPDSAAKARKENEKRVFGIVANFSCPATPETLLLDPDSAFYTEGLSAFLDRIWVIQQLTHSYNQAGFTSTGTVYSPLKNKFPSATGDTKITRRPSNLDGKGIGEKVAAIAEANAGTEFQPGAREQCANFVRYVLKTAGVDVGVTSNAVDGLSTGPALANSFFGEDIGTIITDPADFQPGDIVGFYDTYSGPWPEGTITHVGIYVGDGQIVDRSTSSRPVSKRSIDTFGAGNYIVIRPNAYGG